MDAQRYHRKCIRTLVMRPFEENNSVTERREKIKQPPAFSDATQRPAQC
jgi:hypothetical protein